MPPVVIDGLLDLHGDQRQAPLTVALVDLPEDRRLALTRRAPARPEVDPDGATAKVGEADRGAVRISQGELGAIVQRPRQLGREIAHPEARDWGTAAGTRMRRLDAYYARVVRSLS